MRILVTGAGPTGLTAAVELKRRGFDVLVVDKRDAASGFSRAVGLLPRSQDLLQASGVTARLLAEGVTYEGARIHRRAKQIAHWKFSNLPGKRFILGLAQDRTEAILSEAFQKMGGEIRYTTALTGYSDTGESITATFGNGASESFDYLLGADGIKSTVRGITGLAYAGYELPETWSIADVDVKDWANNKAFSVYILDHGKVCVVAPMEPNRMRIIANRPGAMSHLPVPIQIENVRREGEFVISVRQVDAYNKGRVFLAGDAAHCHSPVGGRGMNLGIEDACEFAERMEAGSLDGYSASRHAVGQSVISLSEAGRKILAVDAPFKRQIAQIVMKISDRIPAVQRLILRQVLQA